MFLGVKFWDENCSCFCVMVHLLELSPENTFPTTSCLKNIILFGAPGAKASTMVLDHPALK